MTSPSEKYAAWAEEKRRENSELTAFTARYDFALDDFQLAGGRATLAPAGAPPPDLPRARIVFIAEIGALSAAEIEGAMEACTAGTR